MTHNASLACVTVLLFGTIPCLGCQDTPQSESYLPTSQSGQGSLTIDIHDNPLDAKSIWLSVSKLSMRPCGGSWVTYTSENSEPFDLLALQGGHELRLLKDAPIDAGHYCEMRLVLGETASIEFEGGETHPLYIPSGGTSGVKLKGEIIVAPNMTTLLTIDLDAEQSVHQTGNSEYKMSPVIAVTDTEHHAEEEKFAIQGTTLIDYTSFTVTPDTNGTFQLPGGGEISFVEGSVLQPQEFTVTAWAGSESAKSLQYVFSPSYVFEEPGEISIPTRVGDYSIYWDYEEQETTWEPLDDEYGMAHAAFSHFSCVGAGSKFDGYPLEAWYSDPVVSMELRGVFDDNVFGSGYFAQPNAAIPISRGDFIAMHVRASWLSETDTMAAGSTPFADVPSGHQLSKYIRFASSRGIVDGCSPGVFCVNDPLNRAAAAKILVRTQWEKETDAGKQHIEGLTSKYSQMKASSEFGDVKDISTWYYRYVYAARDLDLMRGYKDGNFGPGTEINRVEAAKAACATAFGAGCTGCTVTNYAPVFAAEYARANPDVEYGEGGNPFIDYDPDDLGTNGGNCTNYASQSLLGGLLRSSSISYVFENKDFYRDASGAWWWHWNDGDTFIRVNELRGYAMGQDGRGLKFAPMITRITPDDWGAFGAARAGDIVFADWDANGTFDHTMVVGYISSDGSHPNHIRLAYQSKNNSDVGLHYLWTLGPKYENTIFEVFRPTHYQH